MINITTPKKKFVEKNCLTSIVRIRIIADN